MLITPRDAIKKMLCVQRVARWQRKRGGEVCDALCERCDMPARRGVCADAAPRARRRPRVLLITLLDAMARA